MYVYAISLFEHVMPFFSFEYSTYIRKIFHYVANHTVCRSHSDKNNTFKLCFMYPFHSILSPLISYMCVPNILSEDGSSWNRKLTQ